MDPKGLIKFYNALVSLMVEGRFRPSYGRRGGFKSFNQQNLETAVELLAWLEKRDYEIKPYLAGAFGDHNWCYQPKLERLKEKRYRDAYQGGEAWKWWGILEREERFADRPEGLHPGHEIIKARYFATYRLGGVVCRLNQLAGHFMVESEFCQRCGEKENC